MDFSVNQLFVSTQDRYQVHDAGNHLMYHVRQHAFSLIKNIVVHDPNGTEVAAVREKAVSVALPTFDIWQNGQVVASVSMHFTVAGKHFSVSNYNWTVTRKPFSREFTFRASTGEVVARATRIVFSTGSYRVHSYDVAEPLQIVCVLLAANDFSHRKKLFRIA